MTKMMVAVNRRGGTDRTGKSVGEHSFTYFPHDFFLGGMVSVILFGRPDWRTFVPVTTSNDQNMGKGRLCSITAHSGFRLRT